MQNDDIPNVGGQKTMRIELDNWDQFWKLSRIFRRGEWAFRGHELSVWKLQTTLERELEFRRKNKQSAEYADESETSPGIRMMNSFDFGAYSATSQITPTAERYAIQTFRSLSKKYGLAEQSDIEVLATMQHYGSMTRLLDFSTSMFVALFFAFEKRIAAGDREIVAINLPLLDTGQHFEHGRSGLANYDSQEEAPSELLEAAEAFSTPEDRRWLRNFLGGPDSLSKTTVYQEAIQMANENIASDGQGKGVIPVWVPGNNPRIVAQSGMFLMPRTFDSFIENLAASLSCQVNDIETPSLVISQKGNSEYRTKDGAIVDVASSAFIRLIFKKQLELDAWDILDQANVTTKSIYPDLMGLARGIRYLDWEKS